MRQSVSSIIRLQVVIPLVVAAVIGALLIPAEGNGARQAGAAVFRGDPAHSGVYAGGGPTLVGLAWSFETDGDVVSSPTIAGSRVYVGSNDGHLYALDLESGRERWRASIGAPVTSSPTVAGGLVYVAAANGKIVAVDEATGRPRWELATGPVIPFPWGHESGDVYASSPNYTRETLFVGGQDGMLYALDPRTGTARWRARTGGRIRGTPAVADQTVFVGSFDGRVYAFDLATGAPRWTHETEGVSLQSGDFGFDRRSIQSSPAVANGTVYVGARDGFLYALDARTGTRKWRADHKVSWINSSPAVDKGWIFAGSSDGQFLQALDDTGAERWRARATGIVWSSPAVAGNIVYFGDGSGTLRAVDRGTGEQRWMFRTGSTIYSSPAVSGELIVVGSTDGRVYAVRAADAPAFHRAVFFDTSLARLPRVQTNEPVARALASVGYATLDSGSLGRFLAARVADRAPSVVVFAMDYLPAPIADGPGASTLLRRYLNAGGKVVWLGIPPSIFPAEMPPGRITLTWNRPNELLGVPHDSAIFDRRGVRATAEGRAWGLPERWRAAWSVEATGVTTVLGFDDQGFAAAWVKSFGGAPGTGFVRIPPDDVMAVYRAAEYRPVGSTDR